jgi:hypothetical protein
VLGDLEIRKDALQTAVESGFTHVGRIIAIIIEAGAEVTRELGDWATEGLEMREASRRARADREARDTAE